MGDLRNKYRKEEAATRTRRMQARYSAPSGPPFIPECAGCGLMGLSNPSSKGFGFIRIYAVTGAWQEPNKFFCENCLEAHTGENPHGW
ncbi:MAG: hypothetical protein V4527_13585 [Pseudomonadota bacterium]